MGVKPGDEVVTVSHTADPTVAAIRRPVGATPVFADVIAGTYCMDAACFEACSGAKTRAAIIVHLYGHPADMERLPERPNGWVFHCSIVEDCVQAVDATFENRPVGSFGTAACFSFYPSKNLGAIGDGGMVVARQADVVASLRLGTDGWTRPQLEMVTSAVRDRI